MHGEIGSKEDVELQEKEKAVVEEGAGAVRARQPLSEKEVDEENAGVVPEEGDDDRDEEERTKLPFSKARCIALVLTVTCAAILNVSPYQSKSIKCSYQRARYLAEADNL
jgi:hypothetical protein